MGEAAAAVRAWLSFLEAAGVDRLVGEVPQPWATGQAASPPSPRRATPATAPAAPAGLDDPVAGARDIAAGAADVPSLIEALRHFTLCPLSRTALNLCVGDGDPTSDFMLVGEAPGAEEDRQGLPFVGPSGKLLDRMLAAAGRPRPTTWITNTVFWRPPGNREPSAQELATCLPFLERQIELVRPRLLLFVGGIAARALLDQRDGVTRLRGRAFTYHLTDGTPIPARVMFHPAYLLRRPDLKGLAWRDLLAAVSLLEAG